jgi:hypothetical protein
MVPPGGKIATAFTGLRFDSRQVSKLLFRLNNNRTLFRRSPRLTRAFRPVKGLFGAVAREMQTSRQMMNKSTLVQSLFAASWLVLGTPGFALTNSWPHSYSSGLQVALQIEDDLYNALDAKFRNKLQAARADKAALDARAKALMEKNDENKTLCEVSISAGFVDLISHIAHAKAIDKIQPGYFDQYMSGLARETANGNPPEAPNITEDRYWTDPVMNDQASYFNQMMGMTMAINLSHHYLGRFDKYASMMQSGKSAPINNFLTPGEWESGVRAAAVNSLNCAFGTEGAKALFDAIDKMPRRPAWTAYIVPQNTDIKRLNKQLGKYEVAFFRGGLN